jgi:hypothetical protein
MGFLSDYYLHKAGGGSGYKDDLFGPVCVVIPYVQRGHGIGSFHAGLFRAVVRLSIRGARALGREALNTGSHRPRHREQAICDEIQTYRVRSSDRLGSAC